MKPQRSISAAAAFAVFLLALTACTGDKPAADPTDAPVTASPTTAATASPEPTTAPEPSLLPSQPADGETQVIKGTGIYNGQIDNHSIEIQTEEGPLAFELGAGMENMPEMLNEEDKVAFEYVEKEVAGDTSIKQRVLTKLSASKGSADNSSELPRTKQLALTLEGNREEKTATLASGDGYALYVFDILSFDPAKGRLYLKVDSDYYADIEKLPADFNLDYLLLEGREELSKTGEVKELKGEEREQAMQGTRLFLTATGNNGIKKYIVKESGGQGYIIKMNIPYGDATEGFPPHAFASLNSLVNR
ncbi:hypothetical protein [Paenibacillus sp. URB8-2]|uniref:hypothetical protein n=1 Tax=Paenibacillus sp. URB8-2 TaxID=2741301 RepID=UPI0015C01212|nr:hypothetical protein [Paenibacillus sp. URB8-2]BCG58426.1 hypothetical protein PUR_18510 [Paenibacillus sp. URB8-2]